MTTLAVSEVNDVPGEVLPAVHGVGLPDAAIRRLEASGAALAADPDGAGLVLVSTRLPRERTASSRLAEIRRQAPDAPVIVLAHAGGESLALDFLRAGATAVVAEGNEEQVLAWLRPGSAGEPLVDSYERRLERSIASGARHPSSPPTGWASFEARLHELSQGGTPPRLALIRVRDWAEATVRLSGEAMGLLRRRLAVQFEDLCRLAHAELFEVGLGEYALLARDLGAGAADALGRTLADVTASFSPGRTSPLGLAMGHVGPEVTSDVSTLIELARRAVDVAGEPEGPAVVNADELSRALASSTELDTAFHAVALVERHDPVGGSHGSRVADLAVDLGERWGLEGRSLLRLRLAGRLHELGKVSLPPEVLADPDEPAGDLQAEYRRHPERGAEALRSAGPEVVEAIRGHHERWDGTGYPDGLAGEEIPLGARLIAVADGIDRMRGRHATAEVVEWVESEAGSAFDPELARLAARTLREGDPTT